MRGIGCGAAFATVAIFTSSQRREKPRRFHPPYLIFKTYEESCVDCKSLASRSLAKPPRMSIETPAKDSPGFSVLQGCRRPGHDRGTRKAIINSSLKDAPRASYSSNAPSLAQGSIQLSSLTPAHQASYAHFIPRN